MPIRIDRLDPFHLTNYGLGAQFTVRAAPRRERGYVRGRLPFNSGFMPIAATVKFLLVVTAPWRVR